MFKADPGISAVYQYTQGIEYNYPWYEEWRLLRKYFIILYE